MSRAAHLAELERRHRALEAEIVEAHAHPSVDNLQIVELKRRKLLVKDEIAYLQTLIGIREGALSNFKVPVPSGSYRPRAQPEQMVSDRS
jgi:hypothetical protein